MVGADTHSFYQVQHIDKYLYDMKHKVMFKKEKFRSTCSWLGIMLHMLPVITVVQEMALNGFEWIRRVSLGVIQPQSVTLYSPGDGVFFISPRVSRC